MWKLTLGYSILKNELNSPNLNNIKNLHLNISMKVLSEHINYQDQRMGPKCIKIMTNYNKACLHLSQPKIQ